jgi:hypothetical protein
LVGDPDGEGLIGKQGSRLVRVNNNGVETVASLANNIGGLAGYPTSAEAASGISVVFRIDSPVDVFLTAPDGKQIGVDPLPPGARSTTVVALANSTALTNGVGTGTIMADQRTSTQSVTGLKPTSVVGK